MSDIIKFPHPVGGCRTEYGSCKSRLIVDACQLSADLYEVSTMRPHGEEIELVRVATEGEARAVNRRHNLVSRVDFRGWMILILPSIHPRFLFYHARGIKAIP